MGNLERYFERTSCNWSKESVRLIATPSSAIKNTFFYVQEAGYFQTTPPYFTERANLDSYLIVYTISGEGILCYGGVEYHLKEKQAFWIDCKYHHYYECVGTGGWEILWMHFNGNSAQGYYDEFAKSGFHIVAFKDVFLMEGLLRQVLHLTSKKEIYSEVICSNLIINILTELLIRSNNKGLSLTTVPQYMVKLVQYLDLHFKEYLSLDKIAQIHNISKYHLAREFKKYMGKTVVEYINDRRLNYGKELLQYSDLSVEEIALTCGIGSASYFISLFKRKEGRTPLAYRKEWKL